MARKVFEEITDTLIKRRGDLPHWQAGGRVYFVTFRTHSRALTLEERRIVKACCLFGQPERHVIHFGVVMPDHVHLILHPQQYEAGKWHDLSKILKSMKGVSARQFNKVAGQSGSVWQKESFDRLIRDQEEYVNIRNYIWENPIKKGLTSDPETYEFFILPTLEEGLGW